MSVQQDSCKALRENETVSLEGPARQIATVLVCKNSLMSMGLTHLLSGSSFQVAAIIPDEASLLAQNFRQAIDLFVLISNDLAEGIANTVAALKAHAPSARVVVFADQFDGEFIRMALQAGADGFCEAHSDRRVLLASLNLIVLGEKMLPAAFVRAILNGGLEKLTPQHEQHEVIDSNTASATAAGSVGKLSPREVEILRHLTQGSPNKVIARHLDVAEATVKVHIKAILRKIRVANRTQAAMWASTNLNVRTQTPSSSCQTASLSKG
jgi:two-component system nitrate/nitrite response regulator NarL